MTAPTKKTSLEAQVKALRDTVDQLTARNTNMTTNPHAFTVEHEISAGGSLSSAHREPTIPEPREWAFVDRFMKEI
jgi:hypothetical protein